MKHTEAQNKLSVAGTSGSFPGEIVMIKKHKANSELGINTAREEALQMYLGKPSLVLKLKFLYCALNMKARHPYFIMLLLQTSPNSN